MIGIAVDRRSGAEGEQVAAHLAPLLKAEAFRWAAGTLFVGSGSRGLVEPQHPRPHVLMPLTPRRWVDPLVRDQVVAADALVLVDHGELRRLAAYLDSQPVVVLEPPGHHGVIRSETPREATEADRFAQECPDLFAALTRLGVAPGPFDYHRVAEAVAEAATAADCRGVDG